MNFKVLVPLILSAVIFFAGCGRFGQEDTPEAALNEIRLALTERDSTKLAARADLEAFFATTYDVATIELAKRYDDYKTLYPDDPYFQRDADFLTAYNAEHRERHLNFLRGVSEAYFAEMPEPSTPEANPAAYVANEFEAIRQASNVTIKTAHVDGDRASVIVDVRGDNSLRGRFIGQLTFELAFRRDEENRWHFAAIENLDELTPTLVEKAEVVWITL